MSNRNTIAIGDVVLGLAVFVVMVAILGFPLWWPTFTEDVHAYDDVWADAHADYYHLETCTSVIEPWTRPDREPDLVLTDGRACWFMEPCRPQIDCEPRVVR